MLSNCFNLTFKFCFQSTDSFLLLLLFLDFEGRGFNNKQWLISHLFLNNNFYIIQNTFEFLWDNMQLVK